MGLLDGAAPAALRDRLVGAPFGDECQDLARAVAQDFLDYLDQESTIDRELVHDRVDKALGDEDVARIDVFGSYPRTLPVAYSGLLRSARASWPLSATPRLCMS